MANSNTWTVALTFESDEQKEEVIEIIAELAKQEYRSPSSYIKNLVLRHVQQSKEHL
jgi:hypothetical protein